MMNQKTTMPMRALPAGIGIGSLVSFAITLLLAAIMGCLVSVESLQESTVEFGVVLIQAISVIVGSAVAFSLIKSKRLLLCVLTGAGYFLLLLACTALFFDGQYEGIGSAVLAILIGSLCVGLLGLRGDKYHFKGKRKFKNR